jgi:TolB-like protein/tetratricopeptide (TPR) repeat protein
VFVTTDGRVKILDFGLAKTLHIPDAAATTLTGVGMVTAAHVVLGTPGYMAPEQVRGEPLDQRADIFAFGCVLYELLGGRPAFGGATTLDVLSAILRDTPPPLASIPLSLGRIVGRCLEKDPTARFQDAGEVARALRTTAPGRFTPRTRRWVLRTALASACVLLVLAGRLWDPGLEIRSLAVLPLKYAGDAEQEYFIAGMQEAVIGELSRISALEVRSRTSTMRYRDTDTPLPQMARELRVDGLIEGSVAREADRVAVTLHLIHAPRDRHLWTRRFEADIHDILALHGEVAGAVADQLRVQLTPDERRWLSTTRRVAPDAYRAYLRGIHQFSKSPPPLRDALVYFRQSMDLDPAYGPAYVGLADAYNRLAIQELEPPRSTYPVAKNVLAKALDLDPRLGDAYALRSVIRLRFDWDRPAARDDLERAFELQPNSARVHLASAMLRLSMNDVEGAVEASRTYKDLEPHSAFAFVNLAWLLHLSRRYEDAATHAAMTLQMEPASSDAYAFLGLSQAEMSRPDEAAVACGHARRLAPESPRVLEYCGRADGLAGRREEARRALQALLQLAALRYVDPFRIACLAAETAQQPSDWTRVFEWLERAYDERSPALIFLASQRVFEPVHQDPRFRELMRRMTLPLDDASK